MIRAALIALLVSSPALAEDDFFVSVGRMSISGLSGNGGVFEVGKDFGRFTAALIGHQDYATQEAQDVESGVGAYATFNLVQTDKWSAGIGAAYLDYKVTDHHGLRALFGVPPLTGDSDALEAGITVNRRFGPLFVGLRHFGFTSLNVGVRF